MASSSSPFLTQLHYAFQDFQNLYLVMDYHPGGDFANLIDKFNGSLPEKTAKYVNLKLYLIIFLFNICFLVDFTLPNFYWLLNIYIIWGLLTVILNLII